MLCLLEEVRELSFYCVSHFILVYMQKEEEKEEEELTRIKDVKGGEEDKALQEMTIPTAREAQEQARARVLEQQDDLCKLSRALGILASASVSKMIQFSNNEHAQQFYPDTCLILFGFDTNSRYVESVKNSSVQSRKRYTMSTKNISLQFCLINILCHRWKVIVVLFPQVEFYNTMVEREDVDGEKAAMKAYKAAREDSHDQGDEVAEADEVSSALMEKVN